MPSIALASSRIAARTLRLSAPFLIRIDARAPDALPSLQYADGGNNSDSLAPEPPPKSRLLKHANQCPVPPDGLYTDRRAFSVAATRSKFQD